MSAVLRLVIGQLNFTVGDISGNAQKIIQASLQARDNFKADVILFSELALTGYLPEDLLLRTDFLAAVEQALTEIMANTLGIIVILGYPHKTSQGLYNAAAVISDGKQIARYYKQYLPNYGVFDEKRYFIPGAEACIVTIKGISVAIIICEDVWYLKPAKQAAIAGAKLILCLNASPYSIHKQQRRIEILQQRLTESQLPIVYANAVGGQDEIVFDGGSMVLDANGTLCAHAGFFDEALLPVELNFHPKFSVKAPALPALNNQLAQIYQALVTGLRDYWVKNNFPGVLVGLSGGIDSALTLALAVDAVGKANVHAVLMPSRYTSDLSLELALEQIKLTGVQHRIISIENNFTSFLDTLGTEFPENLTDLTSQNLQARCRGIILMALSNQTGNLVLTTSNKSEIAVGYGTLYGDLAGGFAVLKDVWKTKVVELANYRNTINKAIPAKVISRPPSAELKANQLDEDSLPPYPLLDEILQRYVEQNQSIAEIVAAGFEKTTVVKIANLVKLSEYKRRQSPPGIKITSKAFGRERRYPITSGFIIS